MGFFNRILNRSKDVVENSEPNTIEEEGITGVFTNTTKKSVDWTKKTPDLVKPTIMNLRKCAETPFVHGILNDFVIKSISGFEITGDDEDAVECIKEQAERWNLRGLMYEVTMNNFIDGRDYYELIWENDLLYLRQLAFDGEDYLIKGLWNDKGTEIDRWIQYVRKSTYDHADWKNREYYEIVDEEVEWVTVHFDNTGDTKEITVPTFFTRRNKPHSIVKTVLDKVYMIELLDQMLPQVVYKQANTLYLIMGNKDRREVNLTDKDVDEYALSTSDYHNTGVNVLPFGIEPKMIGETVLPKVQDYISSLKEEVYTGLITPEAVFTSSSSNRSTAVVQLDSDKSGRVLMQEYIQNTLNHWLKHEVFNPQLKQLGKKENSVWLDFNPNEIELEEGEDSLKEDNINVSPEDGNNLNVIRDGESRIKDVI